MCNQGVIMFIQFIKKYTSILSDGLKRIPFFRDFILTSKLNYQKKMCLKVDLYHRDFIRIGTLDLLSQELKKKKISGAVAELGVFQGEFAKYLNLLFTDKKLYLFDTFTGFDDSDLKKDVINNFTNLGNKFEKTNVEIVLKKMHNRQNCIIKKGYFPQSLCGLEENFCFVSLDADLYQPTYEGLKYFYPRLNQGGYIMIHDYNNNSFQGVKAAVHQFLKEQQISYVPIPDHWGSLIITK